MKRSHESLECLSLLGKHLHPEASENVHLSINIQYYIKVFDCHVVKNTHPLNRCLKAMLS